MRFRILLLVLFCVSQLFAARAPEIEVRGNGTIIQIGDSSPSVNDNTDFGTTFVGGNIERTFVIKNVGNKFMTVGNVSVNNAAFSVSKQPAGLIIQSLSTEFKIKFSPTAGGVETAVVSFATSDSDENPFSFTVKGSTAAGTPAISVTGKGVDIPAGKIYSGSSDGTEFGTIILDRDGPVDREFVIKNTGDGDLSINGGVALTGGLEALAFKIVKQPAASIAPNTSSTFTIRFDPKLQGERNAMVVIRNSDESKDPFTFVIHGTAVRFFPEIVVEGKNVSISTGDLEPYPKDGTSFGDVWIGTSAVQEFVIKNEGKGTLKILSDVYLFDHHGPFSISQQPNKEVLPGDQTTFKVTFAPTEEKYYAGLVLILNSDLNEIPFNFAVDGTGVKPEIQVTAFTELFDGDSTPTQAKGTDFGQVLVDNDELTRTITVKNIGSTDLVFNGTPVTSSDANFIISKTITDLTLGPNESTTFDVTFDPSQYGDDSATIKIFSNDQDEAEFSFDVKGFGLLTNVIRGYVWHDINTDGVIDYGEPGIEKAIVRLTGDMIPQTDKRYTLQNGYYFFGNLEAGTYTVTIEEFPSGALLTTGETSFTFDVDGNHFIGRADFGFSNVPIEATGDDVLEPDLNELDLKGSNELVFVTGTPTYTNGKDVMGWDNAVDKDQEGWDGTAWSKADTTTGDVVPWAIFRFADEGIWKFKYALFMTDNGQDDNGEKLAWQTTKIEVLVSITGMEADDFESAGIFDRKYGMNKMQWCKLAGDVTAKYIKLRLLQPVSSTVWTQIVEFGVDAGNKIGAEPALQSEELVVVETRELLSGYPNPFNPTTTLEFGLKEAADVNLTIYDITGRVVAELANGYYTAGTHAVQWNASALPSGTYFARLRYGSKMKQMRLTLMK